MKYSLYIGTNKYSLSNEDDILKLSPVNFDCNYKILIGNKDILKLTQMAYKKLFSRAIEKYNKNHNKKINSYYCKINESNKQALATAILIKINEKNYKRLDEEKITEIFKNQLNKINKIIKNFEIVSAILYFDSSLTMRIIGIPYLKDKTNDLEIRVSKSSCFTQEKVEELRLKLSIQAQQDFLKFFIIKPKILLKKRFSINFNQLSLFQEFKRSEGRFEYE